MILSALVVYILLIITTLMGTVNYYTCENTKSEQFKTASYYVYVTSGVIILLLLIYTFYGKFNTKRTNLANMPMYN